MVPSLKDDFINIAALAFQFKMLLVNGSLNMKQIKLIF